MSLHSMAGGGCRGSRTSTYLLAPRLFQSTNSRRQGLLQLCRLFSYAYSRPRSSRQHRSSSLSFGVVDGISRRKVFDGRSRQYASFWGWRAQSFWHRPGCKWVRSEGDLRHTPRDKDCPACQEESSRPMELSHKELIWQRQMQFMRSFMEKDPYEALFGRSNDRLRGVYPRLLWNEGLRPLWLAKGWDTQHMPPLTSDRKINNSSHCMPRPPRSGKTSDTTPRESESENSTTKSVTSTHEGQANAPVRTSAPRSQPIIQGYGRWSVSTIDHSGKTTEDSGEMIYDPITMRMVPSTPRMRDSKPSEAHKSAAEQSEPSMPVKEYGLVNKQEKADSEAGSQTPVSPVSVYADSPTIGEPVQRLGEKSCKGHPIHIGQVFKNKCDTQPSSGSNSSASEQRLVLIRKARNDIFVAQSRLKASISLHNTDPKDVSKISPVSSALISLRKSQVALQPLKDLAPEAADMSDGQVARETAVNSVTTQTPAEHFEPKTLFPIKQALEKSWLRENGFAQANATAQASDIAKFGNSSPSVTKAGLNLRTKEITAADKSGHFRQGAEPASVDPDISKSHKMVGQRDRALKHMSAWELGIHRAALLKSWAKTHESRMKTETPLEKKLNEEISTQKAAMTAIESAWRMKRKDANTGRLQLKDSQSSKPQIEYHGVTVAEGDMCPNAAKYAKAERWYKKKAPHALFEEQQKLQDRALVSSLKEIYEDTYGMIDGNHHQGNSMVRPKTDGYKQKISALLEADLEESSISSPQALRSKAQYESQARSQLPNKAPRLKDRSLYQILAYDPSTQSVHTAIASSSFSPPTGDKVLSVADALPRLHHPAKFLPYLAKHQAKGYEVVSANKNLLVLKRICESFSSTLITADPTLHKVNHSKTKLPTPNELIKAHYTSREAFVGQIPPPKTSTGNFASPTGFVNHDLYEDTPSKAAPTSPPKPSSIPSPGNPRVRKEEAVFTGRSNIQNFKQGSASSPSFFPNRSGSNRSHRLGSFRRIPSAEKKKSSPSTAIAAAIISAISICSGLYLIGWSMETFEKPDKSSSEAQYLSPWVNEGAKQSENRIKLDNFEQAGASGYKIGFWAAVNREQMRRAAIVEEETELQRLRAESVYRSAREREAARKLSAVVSAGLDVALFGTLLWVFMKFLESSGK